jgi:hypothetical protein
MRRFIVLMVLGLTVAASHACNIFDDTAGSSSTCAGPVFIYTRKMWEAPLASEPESAARSEPESAAREVHRTKRVG